MKTLTKDDDAFLKAKAEVTRTLMAASETASRWMADVDWPSDIPPELASRLGDWSRIATDLGDHQFADFLSRLATPVSPIVAADADAAAQIQIRGLAGRSWELWVCDPLIPTVPVAVIRQGADEIVTIDVKLGTSLLLHVETSRFEPIVRIPLFFRNAVDQVTSVDLSGLPCMPASLSKAYVWVPTIHTTVGGDLLARNALPLTAITIGEFAVQIAPVTVGEFVQLGGDISLSSFLGRRLLFEDLSPTSSLPVRGGSRPSQLPVVGLSLDEVCGFLSRLPCVDGYYWDLLSSEEWEVLLRGPENLIYPWGGLWWEEVANVRLPGHPGLLEEVMQRPLDSSRWGIRDGAGNVEEWTQSSYDGSPVAKGGSWYNDRQVSRCASRVNRASDFRHPKLGFRLALRAGAPEVQVANDKGN